ncbi:mitotic spindle checkpoint protein Bub3 [Pichia californica]|uniref:Mitotic spindle checkpoint protein Bub3 n=1 Tax=Pichia californica TaxID=460514 RepID=A0A9P6WM10_9ASCO|nr:mitotic spindle checkpoint protein Bub3 [[Candida] californica]
MDNLVNTYGAILNDDDIDTEDSQIITRNYRHWISDTQILTCILIYICYLRDGGNFNFCIRIFIQMILYNIPNTDNLEELRHMISDDNLKLQIIRINMMLVLLVPYIIMNFLFTLYDHCKLFNNSVGLVDWFNLINKITDKTLNSTVYIHEGLFINIIGESSMNIEYFNNNINNIIYLMVIDIAIVDYNSPYYIPFKNIDDPRPVDQLIYRFSIWKMIIKQVIFYFKEMSVFKNQTYQGNRAMLENLEILKRQNSGKLKVKANANRSLKKSLSSSNFSDMTTSSSINATTMASSSSSSNTINNTTNNNTINNNIPTSSSASINMDNLENEMNFDQQNLVNKLLQTTFLPPYDNSILSISTTFFNNHNNLKEKELLTYQHLTNRLIPRLENLKDQLNETIRQMNSIKNSSDYKTKNLKREIAKTGGILSDYVTSIELLRTGKSKSSLGTDIKLQNNKIDSKLDPYILKLKLDLQLKDQLYIEAHLKEMYYDLQYKSVQLEKILYTEIQNCISTYTDLIDSELKVVKDNLIQPFKEGFIKNDPTIDWDYFIKNDNKKNFLPINAKNTLDKVKRVRKNSDINYPYRNNAISSCIYSGFLDRKSKYLKSYSKFYYVLTINFLHEFKSNDRIKDLNPLQSFSLTDLTVATVDDDPKKFVIRVYKGSDKDSKTKFTFKSDSIDSALKWIDYLSDLAQFENTIERNLAYDVSDDDDNNNNNNNNSSTNNGIIDNENCIPISTEQNNFLETTSTVSSPASSGRFTSHSRSTSDDLNPKSQYQQVQNSLQQDYFSQTMNNNINNLGNVSFKSIKSQPNMRQVPSNSNIHAKTTSNSRTSSRTSSRASSPSAIKNSSANRPIISPKLGTVTNNSTSNNGPSDYFSYAPRKVQASIIRNGNRLASTGSSGRLTPGSLTNSNSSTLTLNVAMSKNQSSSSINNLDKSPGSSNIPNINIHDSTPVNTERPTIFNDEDNDFVNSENKTVSSGLERRRKTLSEKLDITGLISANKSTNGTKFLGLSDDLGDNLNSISTLPETPGIIPGSMMNQVFDTNQLKIQQQNSAHLPSSQHQP